ncbi:hypothetical protein JCM31598_00540 [Desulfonatronum parangueonense]
MVTVHCNADFPGLSVSAGRFLMTGLGLGRAKNMGLVCVRMIDSCDYDKAVFYGMFGARV